MKITTAEAILRVLESPNLCDRNLEPANIVDVVADLAKSQFQVAEALREVAKAIRETKSAN